MKKHTHAERLAFYLNDLIEQIEQFPVRTAINMSHAKDAIKQYDKQKGK
jgi:uncharacterized protein YlzI (FlbEa/FlbD family)